MVPWGATLVGGKGGGPEWGADDRRRVKAAGGDGGLAGGEKST